MQYLTTLNLVKTFLSSPVSEFLDCDICTFLFSKVKFYVNQIIVYISFVDV